MRRSRRYPVSPSGKREAGIREFYAATHIHHAGNDPKFYGKPFFLEDWQRDNIWNPIFGTGRIVGQGSERRFVRRYRTALIGMPRDFGKTELDCAMLLSECGCNPVPMGQYGIIAYSDPQSRKILSTLTAMIRLDPDLDALWECGKHEIVNRENQAVIKVFPYSPGAVQSWHFNFLIADELHVWKDGDMFDAIASGMAEIPNSMLVAITTASGSRSGFLWDWLNGTDERRSVFDDDEAYCFWWGANDDDDIDDERMWRRLCLPSWQTVDGMRRQRKKLTRSSFERYALNRFPAAKTLDASVSPKDVAACRALGGDVDFSKPFTLAVDGAVRGDAFAVVAHQKDEDGTHLFHEWVYEEPPADTGYYDVAAIGQLVAGLSQRYGCPVGIDPARLLLWANVLQDEYGVEIYQIRQDNKTMCAASSLMVNAVRSHKARLGNCPKLAKHLGNCRDQEREPFGKRFTSTKHGQGSDRIDAAIAAAMAMWMTEVMPEPAPSFAETGGVYSLDL